MRKRTRIVAAAALLAVVPPSAARAACGSDGLPCRPAEIEGRPAAGGVIERLQPWGDCERDEVLCRLAEIERRLGGDASERSGGRTLEGLRLRALEARVAQQGGTIEGLEQRLRNVEDRLRAATCDEQDPACDELRERDRTRP